MEVLLLAVMCAANVICFAIGAKVGQAAAKGEKIKAPALDPLKAYREHKEKQEAQSQRSVIDTIMHNVEAYNGTAEGQKDIPRG